MKMKISIISFVFVLFTAANLFAGDYILQLQQAFQTVNGKIPLNIYLSHDGTNFTKAYVVNPYWLANYQGEYRQLNYRATLKGFTVNTTGLTVSGGGNLSGTISMTINHPERPSLTRTCNYTINCTVAGNNASGTYSGTSGSASVNGIISGTYHNAPVSIQNSKIHLVLDNAYTISNNIKIGLTLMLDIQGSSLKRLLLHNSVMDLSIYYLEKDSLFIVPFVTEEGEITYAANKTQNLHAVLDSSLTITGSQLNLSFKINHISYNGTTFTYNGTFNYHVQAEVIGNHLMGTFTLKDSLNTTVLKTDYCMGIIADTTIAPPTLPSLSPVTDAGSSSDTSFSPPYFNQPDTIGGRLFAANLWLYNDPMTQPFKSDYVAYSSMGTSNKQYDNTSLNVFGAVRAYKLLSEHTTDSVLAAKAKKYAEKVGYYYISRRFGTYKINEYYKGEFWTSFWIGWAMLDLYEFTGDQQWLNLAIDYANTLRATQQAHGTWTYVDEETGAIGTSNARHDRSNDNRPLHCAEALMFLGRLRTKHNIDTFSTVEANAYNWMKAYGTNLDTAWIERGGLEHYEGDGPVLYLRYMLEYAPSVNQAHFDSVLALVESEFVNWRHRSSPSSFLPHVISYWPRHNPTDVPAPSTSATSGLAWVYLKLYQQTNNTQYKEKARELFFSVLATQVLSSGRIDHLGRQTYDDHLIRIRVQDQHQYTGLKALTLSNLYDIYSLLYQINVTATDPDSTLQLPLGSTNNVLYRVKVKSDGAASTINAVNVTTLGTYSINDVTNFRVWYSADSVFRFGIYIGKRSC